MRIAARNKRVTIMRDVEVGRTDFGEAILQPSTFAVVRAQRRTTSGREYLAGRQEVAEERATFTIRFRDDLTVRDRLEFEGRSWNIQGFRELGRRKLLEIQAVAS